MKPIDSPVSPARASMPMLAALLGALALTACGGHGDGPGHASSAPAPLAPSHQAPQMHPLSQAPQRLQPRRPATQAHRPADAARAATAARTAPRGLRNHCASCAVAALTQLLLHDATLRAQIAITHPDIPLDALASAYVSPTVDDHALDHVYERYLESVYALLGRCGIEPGAMLDVTDLWSHQRCGLGLPLETVHDSGSGITSGLARGQRAFSFALPAAIGGHGPAHHGDEAYASFVELPEPQRLLGLICQTGGHFVAYVHRGDGWWRLNDSVASRVSRQQLEAIAGSTHRGIELALYAP